MARGPVRTGIGLLAVAGWIGLSAGGLRAEVRPLMVVGSSPIQIGSPAGTLSKEKAIDAGLWDGVVRVARDLIRAQEEADAVAAALMESGGSPSGQGAQAGNVRPGATDGGFVDVFMLPGYDDASGTSPGSPGADSALYGGDPFAEAGALPGDEELLETGPPLSEEEALAQAEAQRAEELRLAQVAEREENERIRRALGLDTVSYTKSFRIVEDQGERPAIFTDDPDVATEYLVLLEVQVEVDRVRAGLEQADLLRPLEVSELTGIEVEVLGLGHYAGYRDLLALLRGDAVEAAEVFPRHFGPDRVVLVVECEWEAGELMERVQAGAPENLVIEGAEVLASAPLGGANLWGDTRPPEPDKLRLRGAWAPLPEPEAEDPASD